MGTGDPDPEWERAALGWELWPQVTPVTMVSQGGTHHQTTGQGGTAEPAHGCWELQDASFRGFPTPFDSLERDGAGIDSPFPTGCFASSCTSPKPSRCPGNRSGGTETQSPQSHPAQDMPVFPILVWGQ